MGGARRGRGESGAVSRSGVREELLMSARERERERTGTSHNSHRSKKQTLATFFILFRPTSNLHISPDTH